MRCDIVYIALLEDMTEGGSAVRFVATNCLREGMRLARPLYRNVDTMLAAGVVLTERYIDSIQRCGFSGVYIDDELSADIEIRTPISDELRCETTKSLTKIIDLAASGTSTRQTMPSIAPQVESIVDELFENKDIMVNMLDLSSYDNYTCSHSLNVGILSIVLAMGMGFPRSETIGIGAGALLHDIGKVFVNKSILQKNGPLTDEEFEIVKNHPKDGYEYISKRYHIPLRHCATILDHHEKFDGTGYPSGKIGTDISIFGRICAVADVYDALSSKRPYRDAMPPCECVEYIMGGSDTLFDPKVVDVFTQRIAPYPVGTSVKLSNGWVGLVVENYISYSLRPKVRIYQQDGQFVSPFEISLKDDFNYLSVTITGLG